MSAIDGLVATYGPSYRWFVTATAIVGSTATILSSTSVNVTLPAVMGTFGVGQEQAQWLATGFLGAATVAMLTTAWLVATFGQRTVYVVAIAIFAVASVLGAVSPTLDLLIASRIVQGACAGLLQPLVMLTVFRVFPADQRGTAMGIFGIGAVMGPAMGPLVGGLMTDALGWRSTYLMPLPFCVVAAVLGSVFMPPRDPGARSRLDWVGLVLLIAFVFSLLTGLSNLPRAGWQADSTFVYFWVAATAAVTFIAWELSVAHPLVELRILLQGGFAAAAVLSFVIGAGVYGSTYMIPLFVQTVQGFSATQAGLLLLPAGLAMALGFPLGGRLADRLPPHVPIMAGLIVFGYASYLMGGVDTDTPFWLLAWWVTFGRIGMSLVFPSMSVGSLRTLPVALIGHGSGTMNFVRQLGGTFGVNLLAILLVQRTAVHGAGFAAGQTGAGGAAGELLARIAELLRFGGVADRLAETGSLRFLAATIWQQASMLAFREGFLIVATIFALALIPAYVMGRVSRRQRAAAKSRAGSEALAGAAEM